MNLEACTDMDYAGSLDGKTLTSGYCAFLSGNLVTRGVKSKLWWQDQVEIMLLGLWHWELIYRFLWLKNSS